MNSHILNFYTTPIVDEIGVKERVARLNSRSVKKQSKMAALHLALSMIDLTTLEGMDTPGKVIQLCQKAKYLHAPFSDLPMVAAICVYPTLVKTAKQELEGTAIAVASVATGFPSGQTDLQSRLAEITYAIEEGADEVDMVISRGKFLAGEYESVFEEIARAKEICGKVHLKVILETAELTTLDQVRRASEIAISAGADFIKTSTGKAKTGATQPVTLVMLETIRDHHLKTGEKIGMKPAGGISDSKTAIRYLVMVKETLGVEWLTPKLFRFGASSLANDVLMQIAKQKGGAYQSADYFSKG
ncbi:MAG: deoxyribose-phosphate aldolase [Candidatus Marinimicrobia bacterium]|nr:deoxyribose-phosphate aldolase [Candidatus Neomarinimicrobiota bacterium]